MKKFVIAAMIAACIALCTAVWLHGNAVGETPVPATKTAVSAKKATVVETETEENSAPEPTPPQPPKELQPGDKVYVAGFGWVEYEGPNHCEDGTDIYENGNKIGIMG